MGALRHLYLRHQAIFVDYPVRPMPRYGYGCGPHREMQSLLDSGRDRYGNWLRRCRDLARPLIGIPVRGGSDSVGPAWINGFLPGGDSVALYTFLVEANPARYLEIGSGNSTRFARKAIQDHSLRTQIISVDPRPRLDIDSLADILVREPIESTDLSIIATLRPGDILFIDGSHRCFTNSDVAVVFMEILPRLPRGVLVQFHDIYLPYDYPPAWRERYYSEQYLLAAYLLGGARNVRVLLPNAYVGADAELSQILAPFWDQPGLELVERQGCSFWLEIV